MKKKTEKEKKQKARSVSLRWYLHVSLAVFLVIVIAVTWFFQIFLLNLFYERGRREELLRAGDALSEVLGTGEMQDTASELAVKGSFSLILYRIEGNNGIKVLTENEEAGPHSSFIPSERLFELYKKAQDSDGVYLATVSIGGHEVKRNFWQDTFSVRRSEDGSHFTRDRMSLLYVRICQGADGEQYMILFNTPLVPLDSTVTTLQRQFLWITVILLGVSVLFSVVIARKLLRPISRMNQAAMELAKGNYDVDFSGSGYRETQELADTLNYAAEELSRTDRLQKELIANISHDLRTPLTMIRGYSEAMRDIPGENSPENIQVIIDETARLSELVNDLLDLSRIQSGARNSVMEFFDLSSAVREVLERYEAFTKGQGYTIRFETDDDVVPVFADRGMILQVLYNLINNAINYAGDDRSVTVNVTVREGKARVEVRDHGEGIPEEQIPLIWDRYYKVDRVHKMAKVGTGLGLSIVKGILEQHNAVYGVESEVGKGSVFWFELPVSATPQDAETQPDRNGKEQV